MALVIPPGFAQLVYRFTLASDPEPMVVTIGRNLSTYGGIDQADVDTMAGYFTTASPASSLYSVYRYEGMTLYQGQDGAPPVVWESSPSVAFQGTAAGETLPQNCAYLVRKRTALGGRRGRGRMYVPPFWFSEATVDSRGYLTSAAVTAAQTRMNNWFSGSGWVILHAPGISATPDPTEIVSFVVQNQIATQRRRMRP